MSEHVWITTATSDDQLSRPIRAKVELNDDDKIDEMLRDTRNRSCRGQALPASRFPDEMFVYRNPMDPPKVFDGFPQIFHTGFLHVSGACAEVLRNFDLNGGGLYPVKIYQQDHKTLVPGSYFHLNIGASKDALLPEQSPGISDPLGMGYSVSGLLKNDEVAVSQNALEGADLWVDSALNSAMFFSDRLWLALKAAKVHAPFRAKRCRIISN